MLCDNLPLWLTLNFCQIFLGCNSLGANGGTTPLMLIVSTSHRTIRMLLIRSKTLLLQRPCHMLTYIQPLGYIIIRQLIQLERIRKNEYEYIGFLMYYLRRPFIPTDALPHKPGLPRNNRLGCIVQLTRDQSLLTHKLYLSCPTTNGQWPTSLGSVPLSNHVLVKQVR